MPKITNDPLDKNLIPSGDIYTNITPLRVVGDSVDQEVNFGAEDVSFFMEDDNVPIGVKRFEIYGKDINTDPVYVDDNTASGGTALKLSSGQQVRWATKIPYDSEDTYMIQIRARQMVAGNIVAGVIGFDGETPINRDGLPLLKDFVECVISDSDNPIDTAYVTFSGFISGNGSSYIEPAHSTGSPSPIPTGSLSFGVMVKAESGEFRIDSISFKKVIDISDTEGGQDVLDAIGDIETTLSETDAKFGIFTNVDTFALSTANGYVYLYGFKVDGTAFDGNGIVSSGNVNAVVPNGSVLTISNNRNLLLLSGSTVTAVRYNPNTGKIINNGGVEQTSGVIIGEVNNVSGVCSSPVAYTEAKSLDDAKEDELQRTFEYLVNSASQLEFETRSQAMGIDNFFNFFVAYEAIIKKLYVGNITAGTGDGTASSGMRFRVHTYDETTGAPLATPIWDVYYDDKKIFEIDPSSGDIFLGDIASGGLKWDYGTSTLRSKDDKLVINTDGTIQAFSGTFNGVDIQSGIFTGELVGASGLFKGVFETAVLVTKPGSTASYNNTFTDGDTQARDIYRYYETTLGFADATFYKTTLSGYSNVEYMKYRYSVQTVFLTTYESFNVDFYDSTYTLISSLSIGSDYRDGVIQGGVSLGFTADITLLIGGDELYMYDLPITQPTESKRVWNDGGILKITN